MEGWVVGMVDRCGGGGWGVVAEVDGEIDVLVDMYIYYSLHACSHLACMYA